MAAWKVCKNIIWLHFLFDFKSNMVECFLFYAQVSLSRIYSRMWTNWPFLFDQGDLSWSFWPIPINLNTVTSHPCHFHRPAQKFSTVQNVCVPKMNSFHSWLCALKMCSFLLCHTAYLLYSGHSYCILVVLTLYYVVRTCKISPEDSAK